MRVEEEFRQYLGEDFFLFSPQKYFFDANFLFRSAVPFLYFSIFPFSFLLILFHRVAIWIEAENKKMENFYGTKRKCVEK